MIKKKKRERENMAGLGELFNVRSQIYGTGIWVTFAFGDYLRQFSENVKGGDIF